MSGTDVCKQLRPRSAVPVIMVTARDSEIDKVVGLELGADDYVTKPYSARELIARDPGGAAPRRSRGRRRARGARTRCWRPARCGWTSSGTSSPWTASRGAAAAQGVRPAGVPLRNAGRVLTRGQLIDRVWGADYVGDTKTLDVHVKRLRAKIEPDPLIAPTPAHRPRPWLQVDA